MSLEKTEIICDSCGHHYVIAHQESEDPKYCPFCQVELEDYDEDDED